MQGVLNQNEFDNPRRYRRWFSMARGYKHLDSPHEGGIWNPLEVKLSAGKVLFRIGHSRSKRGSVPLDVNLSSPWWFEPETFADISVTATRIGDDGEGTMENPGATLKNLARLKLSVSERYGVFDTIFCVSLRGPLGVFRGRGNAVYDPPEDDSVAPRPVWAFPGGEVMQCFVPGLRDLHDRPAPLLDEALKLIGKPPVSAWQQIRDKGLVIYCQSASA